MKPRFLLSILVLFLTLGHCLAAQSSEQLSSKEEREARRIAKRFSQRLLQTKDIAPLLRELFAPKFIDGYLKDREENWFTFGSPQDKLRFSRTEIQKFYVAQTNWLYLSDLCIFSKHPPSESVEGLSEEAAVKRLYPADVLALVESNPYFNPRTISTTNEDDLGSLITKDSAHLRSVTNNFQRAGALLRRYANKIRAGHTRQYRETLADWNAKVHLYRPWPHVCDEPCLGLPKGTRLIRINVPSFQLELMMADTRMEIVKAIYYID